MRALLSLIVVIAVPAFAVAVVYGVMMRKPLVTQPIAFNHVVHLNDAGLQCLDCHRDAATRVHAGLPGKAVCFECHDIDEEGDDTHPEKVRLFSYDELDDDIPWNRVRVTRPDVFFSHRRHVTSAGLECLECHPEQPELEAPPAHVELVMSMDTCIECHERNRASSDCLVCHR